MPSSPLVCLFVSSRKNYSTDVHKIRQKDDRGPQMKPLDFDGNPDHVTLVVGLD